MLLNHGRPHAADARLASKQASSTQPDNTDNTSRTAGTTNGGAVMHQHPTMGDVGHDVQAHISHAPQHQRSTSPADTSGSTQQPGTAQGALPEAQPAAVAPGYQSQEDAAMPAMPAAGSTRQVMKPHSSRLSAQGGSATATDTGRHTATGDTSSARIPKAESSKARSPKAGMAQGYRQANIGRDVDQASGAEVPEQEADDRPSQSLVKDLILFYSLQ